MSWSFSVLDKGALDNNMAMPVAEGAEHSEVATTSPAVSEIYLDINRFPGEIRKKIFRFAMTAKDGRFEFTDLVGPFKPNVATGLLRAKYAALIHDPCAR